MKSLIQFTRSPKVSCPPQGPQADPDSEECGFVSLDGLPDLMAMVSPDGFIREVNRALEQRLGFSREELVGKRITVCSPETLPGGIYEVLKEHHGDLPQRFNLTLQTCEQMPVYTDAAAVQIGRDGEECTLVSMRDIGEIRAGAEDAEKRVIHGRVLMDLAALQAKVVPETFDQSVDAVLKKVGEIAEADRVYLFQCTDDQAFFSNTHEWCAKGIPEAKERHQRIPSASMSWWIARLRERKLIAVDRLTDLPEAASAEKRFFEADGIRSLLAAPIYNQGGLLGFVGMDRVQREKEWSQEELSLLRNVSDILWGMLVRIRPEGVLEPTHFEFEQALFSAGVGLWVWNLDSGTVRYSSHFCRMIGFEPYEVDSQIHFLKQRIHPDDFDRTIGSLTGCVEGVTEGYDCEFRLARKDGSWIWVSSKGRGMANDTKGIPHRIIGTHLDITGHKEAGRQIDRAKNLSEHIHLARSEFLSTVSHELRTPMTGIIGMSQLLKHESTCPKQIEMVDAILECSGKMMNLIDHLLDVADLQTANLKIHSREFDVHHVLNDVVLLFEAQAASKKLEIRSDVSPKLPLRMIGDEDRIRQILTALVDNAVKFTPSGLIKMKAVFRVESCREGILTVSVRDSGIGIPAHRLDDIFEPFIQVDGSNCRAFGGAGLGLVRVKRLSHLMGGSVTVRSVEGKGSMFCVKIPLKLPEDYSVDADGAPVALIAEDNPWNRVVLEKILHNAGWRTEVVLNGLDAVDKTLRFRYDMVFMDIEMPVLSGLDAVRMIRRKEKEEGRPHTVICAVTAYALPGDREKCLAAGMDDYLSKPLKIKAVNEIIQKHYKP